MWLKYLPVYLIDTAPNARSILTHFQNRQDIQKDNLFWVVVSCTESIYWRLATISNIELQIRFIWRMKRTSDPSL